MNVTQQLLTEHIDIWTAAETERKSGRGRASSNAGSVYGIKKLRQLILEMAVRGKLVPQEANDEPASELLKRIQAEKAKLVAEGKIKKDKPLSPITAEEKPLDLPLGWKCVRLPEIYYSISVSGNQLLSSEIKASGLFPVVDQGQRFIAGYTDDESLLIRLPGPVVVFGDHTTERKLINFDFVAGADGVKILCPLLQDERFFWWQLMSLKLEGRGYARHFKVLNDCLYAMPPTNEQACIVAKVDELMALCDQLETRHTNAAEAREKLVSHLLGTLTQSQNATDFSSNWQRIAVHFDTLFTTEASIDALKQTLLQLAVMGKLMPQDVNDEPASELFNRIAREKTRLFAEGKIKKASPLSPVIKNELPFSLPVVWEWARIGQIVGSTDYGLSEKTFDISNGIPVLKMGDIQDGKIILGGQKCLEKEVDGLPELYLKRGDLLYNRTNSEDLVGKTGIYEGPDNKYTFASYLIRIRCIEDLFSARYLNFVMSAPFFRQTQIVPHLKKQCGQANVNGTIMKNMLVPVPPLKEQWRIVATVEELIKLCDQLKSSISGANQLQKKLADALVEHAVA